MRQPIKLMKNNFALQDIIWFIFLPFSYLRWISFIEKYFISKMKWITRERPKIDRLVCPWLIKRFIDKEAEIIYVPFDEVIIRPGNSMQLHSILPIWSLRIMEMIARLIIL